MEGQTEESFVKSVLAPEFGVKSIFIDAHRITKQDQNPDVWFTTMIDFYALPNDFPGYGDCEFEALLFSDPGSLNSRSPRTRRDSEIDGDPKYWWSNKFGLTTLRRECPHSGQWIDRIEKIGAQ